MIEGEILDELSGYEFEDLMEDVFRNLGYKNVRQENRTGDRGRDILMEEVVDGEKRAVVVECKHTDNVSRPVVQKLHSAIATFDYEGPKRGIVVTSGKFTSPAREYAEKLSNNDDPYPIELLNGRDLGRIAEEIGLDLRNGRIEIICDQTLRPTDPASGLAAPIQEEFEDIDNLEETELPEPQTDALFQPVVLISANTNAVFETSVGVIRRVNENDQFVILARKDTSKVLPSEIKDLIKDNFDQTIELSEDYADGKFDEYEIPRFGETQTEYKDWAVERLRDIYTKKVSYTGGNNVTYTKECVPNQSDISVQSINSVYLPDIIQTVSLQEYDYTYRYYAAGPSRVTGKDEIHECVHCDTSGSGEDYTYCDNCGSINCGDHIKTERLEHRPVCTGCAITERFAFKKKYFYDEDNLESFREEYGEMPFHQKALENKPGLLATATTVLLFAFSLLYYTNLI